MELSADLVAGLVILGLFLWGGLVILGGYVSGQKGRKPAEGATLAAVFGPLGVIVAALLPDQEEEGDDEDDDEL